MQRESMLGFYPRFWLETLTKQARWLWLWGRQYRLYRQINVQSRLEAASYVAQHPHALGYHELLTGTHPPAPAHWITC